MGLFKELQVIAEDTQEDTFLPTNPMIDGQPAKLVPRNRQGVGVIIGAGPDSYGNIVVTLDNKREYISKPAVYGGEFPEAFIEALKSAFDNGTRVVLWVAMKPGADYPSPKHFCGLKPVGKEQPTIGWNL